MPGGNVENQVKPQSRSVKIAGVLDETGVENLSIAITMQTSSLKDGLYYARLAHDIKYNAYSKL
jgi:hypothetical protein